MYNDDVGARPRAPKGRRLVRRVRSLVIAAVAMTAAGAVALGGVLPAAAAPSADLRSLAPAGGGATMSVPNPPAGNIVISVKVAGDRIGGVEITGTPRAGVTLRLGPQAGNTTGWQAFPWATCVSDQDGDCNFIVPVKASGTTDAAAMRTDARPWIHQISAPTGWRLNTNLRTGHGNGVDDPNTNVPYRFRLDQNVAAGRTYRSTDSPSFMRTDPTDVEDLATSGGVWQVARSNPTAPAQCGADYAVLMDLSSSIGSQLPAARNAVNTFVDALRGTPSRVALFSFDRVSPASDGGEAPQLRSVRTTTEANAVKATYAGWQIGSGTNWDAGLYRVATASPRYDVVIVLTDGNPTSYGTGSVTRNNGWNGLRDIEAGVFSANLIKAKGTRVVSVGVGLGASGLSELNLQAIAGPVRNSDYFQVGNYSAAATTLAGIAKGACEGSISVTKRTIPASASIPSGATKTQLDAISSVAPGWEIKGESAGTGVQFGTPAGPWTTNAQGVATIPLRFPDPSATGPVYWTETQQPGWIHQPVRVDGVAMNAVCVDADTGANISVQNRGTEGNRGVSLPVAVNTSIDCTIYNRQIAATVTVDKQWIVDGEEYADGTQPQGLTAALSLTGPAAAGATAQPWGAPRSGYTLGSTAVIAEAVDLGPFAACASSAEVSEVNGQQTSIPLGPGGHTLAVDAVATSAVVTNTVTCEQNLTLVKRIGFGAESTDAWVLSATGPAGSLPGPSGRHSESEDVSAPVSPLVAYSLAESGGPATYTQTGEWTCVRTADGATPVPVSGGSVRVPRGVDVTCTVTNATAAVTLLKNVTGGTSTPDAWNLTATPENLEGLAPTTVTGRADVTAGNTFEVRPEHTYTLTEDLADPAAPLAYRLAELQKRNPDGTWTTVADSRITAPEAGGTAVYRFVNEPIPPLSLPLTGGAAADVFLIVGGGLLITALAGTVIVRRRRRALP